MNGTFALSSLLPAEKSFRPRETQKLVRDNFWLLWCIATFYVVVAHAGRRWMLTRERMKLQPVLVVWNWSLAAFSVVGTSRMLPDLLFVWRHHGFRSTVCDEQMMIELNAINYWVWLYGLSKGVELLDTAFVVLRKHPLTRLHWVHHSLTFLFTFYMGSHDFGAGRWLAVVNFLVHCIMYSYFALKAMDVTLPAVVSKAITQLQLLQMVVGLVVTLTAFFYGQSRSCPGTTFGMCLTAAFMYGLYLVLFANFYRHRYRVLTKTRND